MCLGSFGPFLGSDVGGREFGDGDPSNRCPQEIQDGRVCRVQ